VDDLPLLNRLARIQQRRLHQGGAGEIDLNFQRYAQLPAIAKQVGMDGGNTSWSCVEVSIFRPGAVLDGSVGKLDLGAVAHRPVASTWPAPRFENRTSKAGFAQLMGRDQAGDAGAQNDNALAASEVRAEHGERRSTGGSRKAENLHGAKGRGIAANLGDALQEDTSSEAH
jgi:hypothetical protein